MFVRSGPDDSLRVGRSDGPMHPNSHSGSGSCSNPAGGPEDVGGVVDGDLALWFDDNVCLRHSLSSECCFNPLRGVSGAFSFICVPVIPGHEASRARLHPALVYLDGVLNFQEVSTRIQQVNHFLSVPFQ